MKPRLAFFTFFVLLAFSAHTIHAQPAAPLPPGIDAVWDLSKAAHETTPTRERICINGLWHWQPAKDAADPPPVENWGYFKVPGCWPGIGDYMQKDSQTLFAHPSWKNQKLAAISAAWYQREIVIPESWAGRRISLSAEYLNSYAVVYIDGKKVGELQFPAGELDLSSACRAGEKHTLSMVVVAMPLKAVLLSFGDTASSKEVKGSVARRGLCGDVYLVSTPSGARVNDVKVETSVRKWEIKFDAALPDLAGEPSYTLRAQIRRDGRDISTFASQAFKGGDLVNGRFNFVAKWKPEVLWDLHTPGNKYEVQLSLLDSAGKTLDTSWSNRFGFRELWIDGRDFYLNGSRLFLSAVPLDNAQIGAAAATYAAARETMERLKTFGINFVYTHNYDCEPGSHLSFEEILRAADDAGMLVALTQPHFGQYEWKTPDADKNNGYARHAEFYARVAQDHPSVVFYAMSHNATGYGEDMNPDMIDGLGQPRDTWAMNNAKSALRAEAIVNRIDPSRIVYHHSSGNLGSMHTVNFYANFAPVQELSDWMEHWSSKGVKPVFLCEYGVPFTWDWTMYRGWYKGEREFGGAKVPWEYCVAEWNAQFLGDRAYNISEAEKVNLRWEAKQFRAGNLWHRWDYPNQVGSPRFDDCYTVSATYIADNWRAFRTWGMSANSPWEYEHYWKLRPGVDRSRKTLKVDWENLQRPGFSADYLDQQPDRMDLAYERADWLPTLAAEALIRNNRPLLAYIGGKSAAFSSKDHDFYPGEAFEKQIIVINNSREAVSCDCAWSLNLPTPIAGEKQVAIATGDQARLPINISLSPGVAPGKYELKAACKFANGETQSDSFSINVIPAPAVAALGDAKIAIFDPKGETAALIAAASLRAQPIQPTDDLSGYDTLIIGKGALTVDGAAPDLRRVRDGLKVIVFEQTSEVLEKRLGFRVEEYGLRNVFMRQPDHPILAGLSIDNLHDWNGESTLLPPQLKYEMRPRNGPTVKWCDILVSHIWRRGNRGNVASVLIEKPARGDFRPILDGGFALQFSPLMEYREGKGMILFCQMDVTGRTVADAAGVTLARNILKYVASWKASPQRAAIYVGDSAGRKHLESAGIAIADHAGGELKSDQVLIVGPDGAEKLAPSAAAIATFLKAGGHALLIGQDQQDASVILPFKISTRKAEHIAATFDPPAWNSALAGVAPADLHCREPELLPLITSGATIVGDGVLAMADDGNVVFCQITPWVLADNKEYNLRRTYRRQGFLLTRLIANIGVPSATPLLARFSAPINSAIPEKRFLEGLYLDQPEEWDDPYRFFRW